MFCNAFLSVFFVELEKGCLSPEITIIGMAVITAIAQMSQAGEY